MRLQDQSAVRAQQEVGSNPSSSGRVTWVGLFLALFGMLIARQTVSYFFPTLTFAAAIWKESLIWLCAIALLIIIRRGERLPLTSIGLGTSRWWQSILWGLLLAVISAAIG